MRTRGGGVVATAAALLMAGCTVVELKHGMAGAGGGAAGAGGRALDGGDTAPQVTLAEDETAALAGLSVRLDAIIDAAPPSSSTSTAESPGPPVMVSVTYSNGGSGPVRLLTRMLPSEALWEDLFAVTLAGEPLTYVGRVYRRGALTEADFTTLPAGKSVTGRIDLARLYDLPASGEYQVTLRTDGERLAGAVSVTGKAPVKVQSNTLALTIPGRTRLRSPLPGPAPEERGTGYYGLSYVGCDATQKTAARAALALAAQQANDALAQLAAGSGARYATWFGAATSARIAKVKTTFETLQKQLTSQGVTLHCDCAATEAANANAYGYVHGDRPLELHACGLWWRVPAAEQGATVIHELTHFYTVGDTGDVAYGADACRQLAADAPDGAVSNADSYAWFGAPPAE
jgi:peptidyl-Lys metalloendopeptidase